MRDVVVDFCRQQPGAVTCCHIEIAHVIVFFYVWPPNRFVGNNDSLCSIHSDITHLWVLSTMISCDRFDRWAYPTTCDAGDDVHSRFPRRCCVVSAFAKHWGFSPFCMDYQEAAITRSHNHL